MNKIQINIVYAPQVGGPGIVYENDQAIIYSSPTKNPNMHNIGMGWYSLRDPEPEDSILVIEPYCVLEPDYNPEFLRKFKNVFTWATEAIKYSGVNVIEINHPSCHYKPDPVTIVNDWLPWNERKDEIVFIANNKTSQHDSELYSFRLQLADELVKKSRMKVSWYGEIPIKRPYYKGKCEDKHQLLRTVKYSVCTENCFDPIYSHNYFTEKMPEVWFGGALPIYMGCYNVNSFNFPVHSYVDLRIYSRKNGHKWVIDIPSLVSRIDSFNDSRHKELISDIQYLLKRDDNNLYHLISFDRMYRKMIDQFLK